jgi:lipoprotein-anchoring transpeptidase ErfK/SrfK
MRGSTEHPVEAMATKPIYEIAREQGLPSHELLEALRELGVDRKLATSGVDEDVALQALAHRQTSNGKAPPDELAPPATAARGGGPRRRLRLAAARLFDRVRAALRHLPMRLRAWRLRRRLRFELTDLGGWLLEMRTSGSEREDLLDERLARARRLNGELLALEAEIGSRRGGTCPGCGLHSRRGRYCLACGHRLPAAAPTLDHRMSAPAVALSVLLIAAAWLMGGIRTGRESTTRLTHTPRSAGPAYRSLVASARGRRVAVYASQGASTPDRRLSNPNLDGAPLVFLVKRNVGAWLQVYLPSRPNGSVGWIRSRDVKLSGHDFRVLIELGSHRLMAWNGQRVIARVPVGVGRAVTPTPAGLYYITELLKQPDPTGIYGPWAFGLSAHSDVLHEFAGRDGILGIHGTDFPSGIGTDVSHGCIRMSNANITRLARTLPLGTPVRIVRT